MAYEQRLMEMWQALPVLDGETVPRRSKVRTAYISSMLPNCWQLDWRENNQLIIDFEGGEVDAMWGDLVTGQDYLSNYSAAQKESLLGLYERLFQLPCGASITRRIQKGAEQVFTLETNFVPMLSKNGTRRIIFGNSEMTGDFRCVEGRLDFNKAQIVSAKFINLGSGVPDKPPFQ